jgi:hypothetical protein
MSLFSPESFVRYKDLPNINSLIGQRGTPPLTGNFPQDVFLKGYAKNIDKNFSLTQSAAGAPGAVTDLHSFTVPAGSLKPNDFFDVYYGGFFNTNNNDKNLAAEFAAQSAETTGLFDVDDLGWQFHIRYGIFDATTVRYTITLVAGLVQVDSTPTVVGGFGGRCISRGGSLTVANMDSNSSVIRVRGQGTTLGDVTKSVALINLTRF